MIEVPHDRILPKDKIAEIIRTHFGPQIGLLEELVNYGSHLILRTWDQSGKQLEDIVAIGNFLKHIVTVLDGIHETAKNGQVVSGTILLRALFETEVSLEWILKADSKNRAVAYYVWDQRRKRLGLLRVKDGTRENKIYMEQMTHDYLKFATPVSQEEIEKELQRLEQLLAEPALKDINAKFEELKGSKLREPDWREPGGINNFREMLKELNREMEYNVFYPLLSRGVHGLAFDSHVNFAVEEDLKISLQPVRTILGLDQLLRDTYNFAMLAFRAALNSYRPEEVSQGNFDRKYLLEWRDRMLSIPKIREKNGRVQIIPQAVPPLPAQPGTSRPSAP